MKAWPILLITACTPHSNCEVGPPADQTQAHFYVNTLEGPLILELWPALPISEDFKDLVVLDEPWLQIPITSPSISVDLEAYEGIAHSSENATITAFLPAVFEDKDGDGQHSQGEPYWALSQTALVYAEYLDCSSWSEHIQTGWNAVLFSADGMESASLEAIEIQSNLLPLDNFSITLETEDADSLSVAIASQRIWLEDYWVAPLVDQPSEASMEITLPPLPPDEHLQPLDVANTRFLDWYYAVELPLIYQDDNDSGAFDTSDSLVQAFCAGDNAIRIGHYPEADRIDEAFYLTKMGIQPGWGLYQETMSKQWLAADSASLVLTPGSCPLP